MLCMTSRFSTCDLCGAPTVDNYCTNKCIEVVPSKVKAPAKPANTDRYRPVEWRNGKYLIHNSNGVYVAWHDERCLGPARTIEQAIAVCEKDRLCGS